jgi:hypothetical protein
MIALASPTRALTASAAVDSFLTRLFYRHVAKARTRRSAALRSPLRRHTGQIFAFEPRRSMIAPAAVGGKRHVRRRAPAGLPRPPFGSISAVAYLAKSLSISAVSPRVNAVVHTPLPLVLKPTSTVATGAAAQRNRLGLTG